MLGECRGFPIGALMEKRTVCSLVVSRLENAGYS